MNDKTTTKREYVQPQLICYGEISELTASGSGGESESASPNSGMGCGVIYMGNVNCPPGGF